MMENAQQAVCHSFPNLCVDNQGKPLSYHCGNSIEGFLGYQQKYVTLRTQVQFPIQIMLEFFYIITRH